MANLIRVETVDETHFRVHVSDGKGETVHSVRVLPSDAARLAGNNVPPESLVRASFEFLLEREPKESILAQFNLTLIGRYFPEYEKEIRRRLAG